MALVSPGTEVTIVDQSQYVSTAANSVPLIILATANNKADPTGTHTVAPGTLSANANTLYQVSSQRDLVSLFGNPFSLILLSLILNLHILICFFILFILAMFFFHRIYFF